MFECILRYHIRPSSLSRLQKRFLVGQVLPMCRASNISGLDRLHIDVYMLRVNSLRVRYVSLLVFDRRTGIQIL
jgi:hypothetical protein